MEKEGNEKAGKEESQQGIVPHFLGRMLTPASGAEVRV
jgi:hypothetical protein